MPNIRLHSRRGFSYRQRTLRMNPNRHQATALARACGTRRWTYNWALEQQFRAYQETGVFIGPSELMRRIVELKRTPEYSWLREVSKCASQAAISDLPAQASSAGRRGGLPALQEEGSQS